MGRMCNREMRKSGDGGVEGARAWDRGKGDQGRCALTLEALARDADWKGVSRTRPHSPPVELS